MEAILFAGSDRIALPTLKLLMAHGWVGGVLSAPPRPQGRGRGGARVRYTPVAEYARTNGVRLFCYEKLDQPACTEIAKAGYTRLVCVAYGRYFPSAFLSLFPHGTMNLHPSLLPRFRGPSPITATLLSGDSHGGVSIIEIARVMDGGSVLAQERIPIASTTTREGLEQWCADTGAKMVVALVQGDGSVEKRAQNDAEVVHCTKITRQHGLIEWGLSVEMLMRQIVAFQRWPGSFSTLNGKRFIVHRASVYDENKRERERCGEVIAIDPQKGVCVQTGRGVLAISRLQLEYKAICDWQQLTQSGQLKIGSRLR